GVPAEVRLEPGRAAGQVHLKYRRVAGEEGAQGCGILLEVSLERGASAGGRRIARKVCGEGRAVRGDVRADATGIGVQVGRQRGGVLRDVGRDARRVLLEKRLLSRGDPGDVLSHGRGVAEQEGGLRRGVGREVLRDCRRVSQQERLLGGAVECQVL